MLPKTAKDTKDSQSRLDFFLMLSKTCPGPCPFFTYLSSSFLCLVFLQHHLIVASSSKSNNSQAKDTCAPIKTGPPAKKAVTILMAQAKKNKEQSIKKFFGIGKYFFYQVVTCLMLN